MILLVFLLAAIVIYFGLHFLISRFEAKDAATPKALHWSGLLAAGKYLRTTALLAAVTYILIVVLFALLSLKNPVTSAELGGTIANMQWFQSKYKIFQEFWVVWLFVMLLLAFIAYRRDKEAAGRDEQNSLLAGKEVVEESLPFLPPNNEMEEITNKISDCELRAKRLEQSWIGTDEGLRTRLRELTKEKQQLQRQLREADKRRRATATPIDKEQQSYTRPRTRFFGSRGFIKTLEASTKSLGHIGTVLLAVCVIGVNIPVFDGKLADRVVHLTDLQVELSKDEALKSFEQVMSEKTDPEAEAEPLSIEDEQVIDEVARLFEESFTSSYNSRQEKDDDDKKHIVFFMRSNLVRDHILTDFTRKSFDTSSSSNGGGSNPDPDKPKGGGSDPDKPPNGSGDPKKRSAPSGTDKPSGGSSGPDKPFSEPTHPPSRISGEKPTREARGNRVDSPPPTVTPVDDSRNPLGAPQSMLGEQVADSLRTGVKGRPRLLDKFKTKWKAFKASFSEPLDPLNLGQIAIGEAIGVAVDNSWQTPNQGLEQVKKVGRTVFKDMAKNIFARAHRSGKETFDKSVRRIYQTLVCRFFANVAGSESLADALNRVRDGLTDPTVVTPEEMAALREVAKELAADRLHTELLADYKSKPSALGYNDAELSENQWEAEQLERELKARTDKKLSAEETKKIDSYEDHYPGQFGTETKTPKGKLLAATEKNLPVPTGSNQLASNSQKLLAQARDFTSLEQSIDVGGILVGRSPDPSQGTVDFRELYWTIKNKAITFFVSRVDGSEIVAGPFEKSLVHQALAYVADDRKVLVTIISGGEGRRKILLHPALVDTRLGHDIIEFDKLVFRFVNHCDATRKQWDDLIGAQLSLYYIAVTLRQLSALRQFASRGELTAEGQAKMKQLTALEEKILTDPETLKSLKPGLADAEGMQLPQSSILAWNETFFDPTLVSVLSQCAWDSGEDLHSFHSCLSSHLETNADRASFATMQEWLNPPPRLGWRSIAEELSYQTDSSLSFFRQKRSANVMDNLWPFQFRYEIAFPMRTPDGKELEASSSERKPWEFASLRKLIADKVQAGVESDADLRALYKRVRDFTVLQRFFRTSLEGKLGERYPIEKLGRLMKETAGSLSTVQTPRWDESSTTKCVNR